MGLMNHLVFGMFATYVYIVGGKFWKIAYAACEPGAAPQDCIPPLQPAGSPLMLYLFVDADGAERSSPDYFWREAEKEGGRVVRLLGPLRVESGETLEQNLTLPFGALGTRRNGSLWAHAFFFGEGQARGEQDVMAYQRISLTRHLPLRSRTAKRLLGGGKVSAAAGGAPAGASCGSGNETCAAEAAVAVEEEEEEAEDEAGEGEETGLVQQSPAGFEAFRPGEVVTHMRPHLKLRSSHPSPPMKRDSFPPELHSYLVHVNAPRRQPTLAYRPLLLPDEFLTRREWVPVSPDPARLDPQFTFSIVPVPLIGFTVYSTLGESMRMLQSGAGLSEEDLDELKELVSGSNLRWWALTTLVSLLHGLFSYLAFSNDVGFWRGKTSLEGLSIRSFFSSLVCQLIIFLKLCDGGNVSWLILVEVGIGVAIEAWKVSKIMARRGMLSLGYWTGKGAAAGGHAMSQLESDTDEADARAMRYLSYVLYPVVVVWGLYSLVYHDHKGWWSWTVQTAAYGVYLYGFVAMTPQLYINYRLKSVAHLPWRAMGYKVFNTFIDDVFAFAIEMPLSHRIACLRDDVIFFGFLYQRWIYPVDKARANEFGRAYEGKEDAAPALDAGASKPSIASAAASGTPAGSAVSEDETKKER